MAEISLSENILPTAALGAVNPLPPVTISLDPPVSLKPESIPADLAEGMSYGHIRAIYPYQLQDGYGRERTPQAMKVVVLENDLARAEFATDFGARLVSFVDKTTGRELLDKNPIFQPANLALRNAWFSGGVEWNIGMRGHSPFTCDPVYAGIVTDNDGAQTLRVWEYERIRRVFFEINFALSDSSPALHALVRVVNPLPTETPMYWWTNMAVPQTEHTRVFVPASKMLVTDYDGTMSEVPTDTADASWPARYQDAADVFYRTDGEVPWIAAVEADGAGIGHFSSPPLTGRKLFVWGSGESARRWNEWLEGDNPDGSARSYLEIQAGLATTQHEHVKLAGHNSVAWFETIMPVQADPETVAGPLDEATVAVENVIKQVAFNVEAEYQKLAAVVDAPVRAVLSYGSLWGLIDGMAYQRTGTPFLTPGSTPILPPGDRIDDESISLWLMTLSNDFSQLNLDPAVAPDSYAVGPAWERILTEAPENWLTVYHRAVIAHADDRAEQAVALYTRSLELEPSAWAYRGRALAHSDAEAAIADFTTAHELAPEVWQLSLELIDALLTAGKPDEALEVADAATRPAHAEGRFALVTAQAAIAAGKPERAAELLKAGFDVADLREGEVSLSALWRTAFPDEPLPARYNFDMK